MAIIKDNQVQALFTAANASFEKGKPGTPSEFEQVATTIVSNTKSNTYSFLGKFPKLREFIGARVLKDMTEHSYTLSNKKYEASVSVDAADIEDDTVGVYAPMFSELGLEASTYPNQYVFEVLQKGLTEKCYDGKAFFAVDHPVGAKGSQQPVSNVLIPEADPTTPWYVLDTTSSLKPLIFQVRQKPKLVQFQYRLEEYDELVYGFKTRFSVGYGFWQRAYASTAELTAENVQAVITAMRSFKDDEGRPLNIKPNLLVIPPSLQWKAKELLESPVKTDPKSKAAIINNPLYKALDILTTNWLA